MQDINKKIRYFDLVAKTRFYWRKKGNYYHSQLIDYIKKTIPEDSSILEIGCGTGDIIGSFDKASRGLVGVDISDEMIKIAKDRYSEVKFYVAGFEDMVLERKFDYILIGGVAGYVDDLYMAFQHLNKVCKPETKIVIVYFNYLWEPVLKLAEFFGLRMKRPVQHWLSYNDISNLLELTNYRVVKTEGRFLLPIYIPLLSRLFNKYIITFPLIDRIALNEVIFARPSAPRKEPRETTCSIIVPCRNEKGNIETLVSKVPAMGKSMELIFVEGHSSDGTYEECLRVKDKYEHIDIKVMPQEGKGKFNAVQKGFSHAKGDVLMILDADMTVPPEDLYKFFEVISTGKGEFINGSRLIYQMEEFAMRRLNLLGNKFFSIVFSYLLGQNIKDTLCGTKVLWRKDYERMYRYYHHFLEKDPFGDFFLLIGASKLNLKITEVPVKYRSRMYGTTQIDRFRHGWMLLKMSLFAYRKVKII